MTDDQKKQLTMDPDGGLKCYEYLANNIDTCTAEDMSQLCTTLQDIDLTGQFQASAARYLHAIDPTAFGETIRGLVACVIDKDREHRYLPDLIAGLYGPDFHERASELSATDDNFRRMYKRLYPSKNSL